MPPLGLHGPIAIGGVGGSGTRIFAEIAQNLGLYMGDNLNESSDNMSFPPIRDLYIQQPRLRLSEKVQRSQSLIAQFDAGMKTGLMASQVHHWGWKVPTTFLHLAEFSQYYGDKLHYVHIMRNGLDMAFSKNQNQVTKWGFYFDIDVNILPLPVASLRYWIAANHYAIRQAEHYLSGRFLLLRFDDLCARPISTIQTFAKFCGISSSPDSIQQAACLVKKIPTIGRYQQGDMGQFSPAEIEAVRELGFVIA